MICTTFEMRDDRIVFIRPEFKEGAQTLVGGTLTLRDVDAAVRKAYYMGRQDNARQVSAVLGSLMVAG